MKITPAFFSSSLKVVTTETESNTASTAILERLHAGQDFLLAQRNAELFIDLQQSPDRHRRSTSGRACSSARRNNRCR